MIAQTRAGYGDAGYYDGAYKSYYAWSHDGMNEAAERLAPSFGLGVLAPATLLLLVPLLIAAYRIRSLPGRFLIAALWIRYICGAYHVYMLKPLAAGLSGNALVSVAIVAVGQIGRAHV